MHGGNAAEIGDLLLLHGTPDPVGIEAVLQQQAAPSVEERECENLESQRVEERSDHQHPVVVSNLKIPNRIARVVERLPMGEEGTFGRPGGARGVHQDRRIVGGDGDGRVRCMRVAEAGLIGSPGTTDGYPERRRVHRQGQRLVDDWLQIALEEEHLGSPIVELKGDLPGR